MNKLKEILSDKEIRMQLLFTAFILVLFRIGSNIPVPGIDKQYLSQVFSEGSMGLFDMFNLFSGGSFQNFTLFALGVTPYITASIIVQLLGVAFPYFENLQKEGHEGREKLGRITRCLTFGIALLQALGYAFGFFNQAVIDKSALNVALITMLLVSGSMLLVWLGERIEEYGIGSGISLLIYGGIVASIPSEVNQLYTRVSGGSISFIELGLIILMITVTVIAVVYVQEGVRKVPVQYAAKVVGTKKYAGDKTYLPLKVNQGGVIPIIFASSVLQFPVMIMMLFHNTRAYKVYEQYFSPSGNPGVYIYSVILLLLIVLFSFFYQEIAFKADEVADNLSKNGGTIIGVRPGTATKKYLHAISSRLTLAGAVFLGVVAILPIILSKLTGLSLIFGGTSLLILVGVSVEIMKRLSSKKTMTSYTGFLD